MNRKFPKYKCECGAKKVSKKAKCLECAKKKPAPKKKATKKAK